MDQFFVYFRFTPRGIKFFVSRDLKPQGQKKTLLGRDDPRSLAAQHVLHQIVIHARTHPNRIRPDLPLLTLQIQQVLMGFWGIENIAFLPKQGQFGDRILVQFSDSALNSPQNVL